MLCFCMTKNATAPLSDWSCPDILGIMTTRENENFYKIRASYFNRFSMQASNDLTDFYVINVIIHIGKDSHKSAFLK